MAFEQTAEDNEIGGTNAAYIPILKDWETATAQPASANYALGATVLEGTRHGTRATRFIEGNGEFFVSLQSVSKTITFGAACAAKAEALGDVDAAVAELAGRIGFNGDPFAFNSQPAVNLAFESGGPATINPYVNAGAMASASAVQSATLRPCSQSSSVASPTAAQLLPFLSFRHSAMAASCRRRSSATTAAVGAHSPWQVLASATATEAVVA